MLEKKQTKKEIRKKEKKEDRLKLKEWSRLVKERDNYRCAYCGSEELINSHHIIPKEIKAFRYDVDNGISLCAKHHRFSFEFSAHQNPFRFYNWFRLLRKRQFNILFEKYTSYLGSLTPNSKSQAAVDESKLYFHQEGIENGINT